MSDCDDSDSDHVAHKRNRSFYSQVVPQLPINVKRSREEYEQLNRKHKNLLLAGKQYHEVVWGSLAYLKNKLNHKIPLTEDELVNYSYYTKTIRSDLTQDELNKLFDTVRAAMKSEPAPSEDILHRLDILKQSLFDIANDHVRRQLFPRRGGKSITRTIKKGRNNRRKSRKSKKKQK